MEPNLTHLFYNAGYILTGVIVDLEMENGWVKKDQYLSVPREQANVVKYEQSAAPHTESLNYEGLELPFVDANGKLNKLTLSARGILKKSSNGILSVDNMHIESYRVADGSASATNLRLLFDLIITTAVLTEDGRINSGLQVNVLSQ